MKLALTSIFTLFSSILFSTVLADETCGKAKVCLIRQKEGVYRVTLNVNVDSDYTGVVTSVRASGFYHNFGPPPASHLLVAPGRAPSLNGPAGKYRDNWEEAIGYGTVQVSFPFIRTYGLDSFCYGSFSPRNVELSESGKKKVCFKETMYQQTGSDLALVIDSTGSMSDDIMAVKKNARELIDDLFNSSSNSRVGIVEYNDPTSSVLLPLSSDKAAIEATINKLSARGGGDFPEHVYSGLRDALGLDYGTGSNRMMVTFGDAPPKDPEPGTGLTLADIVSLANFIGTPVDPTPSVRMLGQGVRQESNVTINVPVDGLNPLYMIPVGTNRETLSSFTALANRTGGEVFPAANASEVVGAIRGAIDAAVPGTPDVKTEDLKIMLSCSDGEDDKTSFRITNPNDFEVSYVWKAIPGSGKGAGRAPSGDSFLEVVTPSKSGSTVLTLSWLKAETGEYGTEVYAAGSECV